MGLDVVGYETFYLHTATPFFGGFILKELVVCDITASSRLHSVPGHINSYRALNLIIT